MNHSSQSIAYAAILWNFLRVPQQLRPADIILVFGGHDPSVGPHAALLYDRNLAPIIVISGGSVHVPPTVDGMVARTEAEAIASYLINSRVPNEAIILETKATNTSENFWFTAELLAEKRTPFNKCILVTKPYTERRTLATGQQRWPGVELQVSGPEIDFDAYLAGDIPIRRIISMMVGEVHRIESYSKQGFLQPQEVPLDVVEACRVLEKAGYNDRALN